jgi:hypothetical protein
MAQRRKDVKVEVKVKVKVKCTDIHKSPLLTVAPLHRCAVVPFFLSASIHHE